MFKKGMTVGVIGAAGDLGRQVSRLLISHGYLVLENDKRIKKSIPVKEIMKQCDIVHYCIPSNAIVKSDYPTKAVILLHDSVMSSSEFKSNKLFHGKAIPVHMLMNKEATVVIAKGFSHKRKTAEHFSTLGQIPVLMRVKDHDRVIARSQAPLLLLVETLLRDLRKWSKKGLLTPSAVDLLDSLESRQANWTSATRSSILRNNQIDQFIDDLRSIKRLK